MTHDDAVAALRDLAALHGPAADVHLAPAQWARVREAIGALVTVGAAVAAEREACAEVCDYVGEGNSHSDAHDCAASIRARTKA